jgi:hypothetical protein
MELQDRMPHIDLDIIDTRPKHRSYPDTFVIGPTVWAALEFKRSKNAPHQPNQDYYVVHFKKKGYANFVYPENAEEVLDDLENLFSS